MNHDIHELDLTRGGGGGGEVERATFPGSVVQLLAGRPDDADAAVMDLHDATITVTDARIIAADGALVWSWMLTDLVAVHHGGQRPWTILDVPGIPDFGVSVAAGDVAAFRRLLDELRAPSPDRRPSSADVPGPRAPADEPDEPDTPAPAAEFTAGPSLPSLPSLSVAAPAAGPTALDDTERLDLARVTTLDPGTHQRARRRIADGLGRIRTRDAEPGGHHHDLLTEPPALTGIDARRVSAWFGTHHVLDRVSLQMRAGEVTALIGPSGCGKSTFLRILNRMHEMIPSASLAGEVHLDGHDIYDPERKLTDARREIGMVFQKPNPFPAMSIYDNVIASLRLTGARASTSEKDSLVESCLTKAGLWLEVRDRLRQPGGGLSGGQQQRLCIARALAIKPRVLLMDEPCSALDPTSTRRIEETIVELVREVTVVIVTHNMQQAARVSNRCAFFLASHGTPGVIVEYGPTDAMFSEPQDERTFDYVNGRFG